VDEKVAVRPSGELPSGCLQSPDDEDATYRKKRGVGYRGQILTATETCNPDNPLQLITDVHVTANNRDDSDELHDRHERRRFVRSALSRPGRRGSQDQEPL